MSNIIYLTDGKLDAKIQDFCLENLKRVAGGNKIIKVENPVGARRSRKQIYENILAGIAEAKSRTIFIAEHDVIYPSGYFDAKVSGLSYSKNVIYLSADGYIERSIGFAPLSTLAGSKSKIKAAILAKKKVKNPKWTEPGICDSFEDEVNFRKTDTLIDIRHGGNFTGAREGKTINTIYGVPPASELWSEIHGFNYDDVCCILTARNEPLLQWTIENIQRTAPGIEIVTILDGWQKEKRGIVPWAYPAGVGQCRNFGVSQTNKKYIIFLDAHMDFVQGWVDKLLSPVRKDRKNITCSKSAVLKTNQLQINKSIKTHTGAEIQWINNKNYPFEPRWKNYTPGEIQCVLGACYGMERKRYFEIFSPWKNALAWGTSEQILSVVNWFLGGKNMLTNALSGHVYRDEGEVPYIHAQQSWTGIYYNRCRLVDLFPMEQEQKKILWNLILSRRDSIKHATKIKNLLGLRDDRELKSAIETGRSMQDYISKWWGRVKFPEKKTIIRTLPQTRRDSRDVKITNDKRFI